MNKRYEEVMNEMVRLRTKVASLWDGLVRRGLEGRRLVRWVISPLNKSIVENTNEEGFW
jgi:hypothetical protein